MEFCQNDLASFKIVEFLQMTNFLGPVSFSMSQSSFFFYIFRPSPAASNMTNKRCSSNTEGYLDSSSNSATLKSLQQELRITKDNLENISKKREDDLDMYLKLASDSRTMYKQGFKEASLFDKN